MFNYKIFGVLSYFTPDDWPGKNHTGEITNHTGEITELGLGLVIIKIHYFICYYLMYYF